MIESNINESDFSNRSSVEIFDGLLNKYSGDEELALKELETIIASDGYNSEMSDAKDAFERIVKSKKESVSLNEINYRSLPTVSKMKYISNKAAEGFNEQWLFKPLYCNGIDSGLIRVTNFDIKTGEISYEIGNVEISHGKRKFVFQTPDEKLVMTLDDFYKNVVEDPRNKKIFDKTFSPDDVMDISSGYKDKLTNDLYFWIKQYKDDVAWKDLIKVKDVSESDYFVDDEDFDKWFEYVKTHDKCLSLLSRLYKKQKSSSYNPVELSIYVDELIDEREEKRKEKEKAKQKNESTLIEAENYNYSTKDGEQRNVVNGILSLLGVDPNIMLRSIKIKRKPIVGISRPDLDVDISSISSDRSLSVVNSNSFVSYNDDDTENRDYTFDIGVYDPFEKKIKTLENESDLLDCNLKIHLRVLNRDHTSPEFLEMSIPSFDKLLSMQSDFTDDDNMKYGDKLLKQNYSTWTRHKIDSDKIKELLRLYMFTNEAGSHLSDETKSKDTVAELENDNSYRLMPRLERMRKINSAKTDAEKDDIIGHNQRNLIMLYNDSLKYNKLNADVTNALNRVIKGDNPDSPFNVIPIGNNYYLASPRDGFDDSDMQQDRDLKDPISLANKYR